MSAQISCRIWGSRPTVGSSMSTSRGRWTSARAISRRRRIPPESSLTCASVRSLRLAISRARAIAAARSGAGNAVEVGEHHEVLLTVSVVSRLSSCGTTPIDRPGRLRLLRQRRSRAPSISPRSAIAWAVSSFMVVLLPAPFGPSKADTGALGNIEVESVDGLDVAVAFRDVSKSDREWGIGISGCGNHHRIMHGTPRAVPQFRLGSGGIRATRRKLPPLRSRTSRHSSSGDEVNTSDDRHTASIQASSSISSSSCPAPQPA